MDLMAQLTAMSFSGLAVALLVIGIILVIIEMFTPGLGAPGITGLILLIIGIALASKSVVQALILAAVVIIFLLIAFLIMLILGSRGKLENSPLVLRSQEHRQEGYLPAEARTELMGQLGNTVTPLRPAGIGQFGDQRVDIVTRGEYIERNTMVKVIGTAGNAVVVAKAADTDQ